jgi:hypothetical protein
MRWGWIRIGIISVAFLVGLTIVGPAVSSAGSKPSDIRVNEHIGGSLIITCDSGDVAVRHMGGESGAVQFECLQGRVMVVREHREMSRLPLADSRLRAAKARVQ